MAWGHAILAGLMTGSFLVLGVAAWHLRRGRNTELFRMAARLAIVVALPVCDPEPGVGQRVRRRRHQQPADEDRRHGGAVDDRAAGLVLAVPDRRLVVGAIRRRRYSIEIPGLLSFLATNSFHGKVVGIDELQKQDEQQYGPGNYMPDVKLVYWSMRVMAYLATLLVMLALWGAWLLHRKRLESAKWFQRAAIAGDRLPVPRATSPAGS